MVTGQLTTWSRRDQDGSPRGLAIEFLCFVAEAVDCFDRFASKLDARLWWLLCLLFESTPRKWLRLRVHELVTRASEKPEQFVGPTTSVDLVSRSQTRHEHPLADEIDAVDVC